MTATALDDTLTAAATGDQPWPAVTVLVPTRDRPELLRRSLDAILGQDYPGEVECLVVFDQSEPDRSLERDDGDRRVRVDTNDRATGLAGARNTGALAATTELVAFCDDDDRWLPGKLRAQVAELVAHPEAAVVGCGIGIEYDGRVVERPASRSVVGFPDLLRSRLSEVHPSTLLIRRAALLDGIGLVDEQIPGSYAEDYEWLLRAARHAPIRVVDGVYVRVLWHARSYFASRWQTIISALTWLLERYPQFRSQPVGAARIEGQIAFAYAALGRRRQALRWATRAARDHWREPRAVLALAVASGAVSADAVLRQLHRRGRGI